MLNRLQPAFLLSLISIIFLQLSAQATVSVSALTVHLHNNKAMNHILSRARGNTEKRRSTLHHRRNARVRQGSAAAKLNQNKIVSTKTKVATTLAKVAHARRQAPRLTQAQRNVIIEKFKNGSAAKISPEQLVNAGVFSSYKLVGGTFTRRSTIQNIVIHSTETATIADAKRVVKSWNNSGKNHAGAQYIVDRDGIIYQTVDPTIATFHVNSFKTLNNVKNDNSIGIEIVRSGEQQYTQHQLDSVALLVDYLKGHFEVSQIWGHGQIQPSDRSDPVAFNWSAFNKDLQHIAYLSQLASKKTEQAYAGAGAGHALPRVISNKASSSRPA